MGHTKKKRRVRYDRIIGVAAVFIVLIILLVAGIKSCGKDSGKDKESSIIPTISDEEKNKKSTDTTQNSTGKTGTTENKTDPSSSGASNMSFSSVTAMPNEVFKGELLLVNKDYKYSFPASLENTDIVPVYEIMSDSYNVADYEVSLSSKAVAALNTMMDEYASAVGNNHIMLINGYRTREYQEELNDKNVPAGCSDYHTGLSFDLGIFPGEGENSYYYLPEGDYAWIDENCANYGFIVRYPEKKEDKTGLDAKTYQFRYVGVPHALYMKENKLCLEEYLELLKGYTSDGEHLKVSGGDKNYEIYYVPADPSANTDIPVPDGKTYEISGNNVDGFIITVVV